MTGPIAPKDPVEKRPGFFILLDTRVGGIPQDDGKGRHPIYISPDRLPTYARVTGGIEDESILNMLTDAAGFRKLVHSVGVSAVTDTPDTQVGFSLNFRGIGGPGSSHRFVIPGDGTEQVIAMEALDWSEYDAAPAEFLFEMPTVEHMAVATVKFYVHDGFDIPQQDPDPAVDFQSFAYREMIARSFLSAGNNARVQSFLRRAEAGEAVTVAFIGGSITEGAGAVPQQENCYARVTYEGLRRRFGDNVRYIKAGVGGTPSETGLMRYDRDVTRDGKVQPDLVVVEFAVNDAGDETDGVFYESLVRHILKQPGVPAVILLFSVFANDWNLKRRLAPIGYRYQLPMVDVLEAVSPQFVCPEGRVITKRQYFYDVYHPANAGHRIMADCLLYLMDRLGGQQPETDVSGYVPPCYGADFEDLILLDRKNTGDAVITPGSFSDTDENLQSVPMDANDYNTPQFPNNWMHTCGSEPFVLELACSKLVLEFKDTDNGAFGKVVVTVDGEKHRLLDPLEVGWTHCHSTVLFNKRESVRHRVEIAMAPGEEEKAFTILGFGYVR